MLKGWVMKVSQIEQSEFSIFNSLINKLSIQSSLAVKSIESNSFELVALYLDDMNKLCYISKDVFYTWELNNRFWFLYLVTKNLLNQVRRSSFVVDVVPCSSVISQFNKAVNGMKLGVSNG